MGVNNTDLAWLAGFIDGEGYVKVQRQVVNGKFYYQPTIVIRNTHLPTQKHVVKLLNDMGIECHLKGEDRGPHRRSYRVIVTGQEKLLRCGEAILPHMVTKKEQVALLVEWCQSRLASKPKGGYSQRELEIAKRFRTINQAIDQAPLV